MPQSSARSLLCRALQPVLRSLRSIACQTSRIGTLEPLEPRQLLSADTILGTSAADQLTVSLSADALYVDVRNAQNQSLLHRLRADLESLTINSGDGDDILSIDLSNDPTCTLPLFYNSGAGANALTLAAGGASLIASAVNGSLSATLSGSSRLTLNATHDFASLTLSNTSRLDLASGLYKALILDSLSLADTATLDLADNGLILRHADSDHGLARLASTTSAINAAMLDDWWGGAGLTSSTAHDDPYATAALAVINNDDGFGHPLFSRFIGQSVPLNSILVKYTCFGDADAHAPINDADYALTNEGWANNLTGWYHGDFNYDGAVNGSDFSLLDIACLLQPDANPRFSIDAPATLLEGDTASLTLSATLADTESFNYWTIFWGDGAVQTATANPATLTHAYAAPGPFPIDVFAKGITLNYPAASQTLYLTPAAPANLAITSHSGHHIAFSWSDNSAVETGFELQCSPTGTSDWLPVALIPANATTFTLPGRFAPSTAYSFRLLAYTDSADSAFSNTASLTTSAFPSAPADLAASANTTSAAIALSWAKADTADTQYFILQRSSDGGLTWPDSFQIQIPTPPPATFTYTDSPFTEGTVRHYRVYAHNAFGDSDYSAAIASTRPLAPSNLTAALQSGQAVTLNWSDNSSIEIGFIVDYRRVGDSDWTFAGWTAPNTATVIAAGSFRPAPDSYEFRLAATADAALSTYATVTLAMGAFPTAPANLAPVDGSITTSSITLAWTKTPTTDLQGFTLQRFKEGALDAQINIPNPLATQYTDTNLASGAFYNYVLYAYNGPNPANRSGAATLDIATLPATPCGFMATAYSAWRIDLAWIDSAEADLHGWRIHRDTTPAFTPDDSNLIADDLWPNAFSDTDLSPATTYYYKLIAVNNDGRLSASTSTLSATTRSAPSISGPASANEGAAAYVLTLNPASNPINYWEIFWDDGSANLILPGSATEARHNYFDSTRSHNIIARAHHENGSHDLTLALTVANQAPSGDISGAASIDEGAVYTLALEATDPGHDPLSHWVITWGNDGVESVRGNPSSVFHCFRQSGCYTIDAVPYDLDETSPGLAGAAVHKTVVVNEILPTALIKQVIGDPGSSICLTLGYTDPGPSDAPAKWLIDWGDGSDPDNDGLAGEFLNHPAAPSHGYAQDAAPSTITATPYATATQPGHSASASLSTSAAHHFLLKLYPQSNPNYLHLDSDLSTNAYGSDGTLNSDLDYIQTSATSSTTAAAAVLAALTGWTTVFCGAAGYQNIPIDTSNQYGSSDIILTGRHDSGYTGEVQITYKYYTSLSPAIYETCTTTRARLDLIPMILSFQYSDFAQEGGNSGSFTLSSTFPYTSLPSITVPLSFTGSALSGTDYVSPPSSITLSPASPSATLSITPIDDNIPEWTETITLTPAGPLEGSGSSKRIELTDNNDAPLTFASGILKANFDDDNNNDLLDAQELSPVAGEDDLYPISLPIPPDAPPGSTLLLSLPTGVSSRITLWDTPNKQRELLGPRAGNNCLLDAPAYGETFTAFVEVTHGSQVLDDITLTLALAQPQTSTITRVTSHTAAATRSAIGLKIQRDNADPPMGGWIELTGQMNNLRIVVEAPEPFGEDVQQVTWKIPPKAFNQYAADDNAATVTYLSDADLSSRSIQFAWITGGENKVRATVAFAGQNFSLDNQVLIQVIRPDYDLTATQGEVRVVSPEQRRWPPGDETQNPAWAVELNQMKFRAKVTTPAQFSKGTYCFVQTVTSDREFVRSTGTRARMHYVAVLDSRFPYRFFPEFSGRYIARGAYDGTQDCPSQDLTEDELSYKALDVFEMSILFQPSDPKAQWVPLASLCWGWGATVRNTAPGQEAYRWTLVSSMRICDTKYHDEFTHPTWSSNSNGEWTSL